MKFKITKEQSGGRLDKFLAENLENLSRSQIQKFIKQGSVLVNNKDASPHYNLKEGDVIQTNQPRKSGQASKALSVKAKPFKAETAAETDEYLIINKPAGLITHGAAHIKETSLSDILLSKYPRLSKVGEDPARPGIVHRLDKEVSGLIVIPKTQKSFDNLKKQFQNRSIEKQYIALVYGQIEKDEDEINFPIERASGGHKMAALPLTDKGEANLKGRRAITKFEIAERYINYTLLKIQIKTGRTHQIRTHMAAYGHPVVGDNLYSTKKTREQNKKLDLGRVFLVANKLSFTDLAGKSQEFEIKMPKELKKLLEKIK